MTIVDPRTWIEILPVATCWDRLAAAPVGRLGTIGVHGPEIVPVNHVVDEGTIVFRTERGSKLDAVTDHGEVCYEVDGFDPATRSGWSVLVKGRAIEVRRSEELHRLRGLPLDVWNETDKPSFVRIHPREVTGREIHHPTQEQQ